MSSKFQRPPLTPKEKEKLAEKFMDGAPRSSPVSKEEKGVIFMRVPRTVIDDLDRIYNLTGYKPNAFCFHAIVEAIKEKLKQIERES